MNAIDLAEWIKRNVSQQTVALMTGHADELERATNGNHRCHYLSSTEQPEPAS
jgi:hypothetical protein